jgi:ABC-type multidrug transport system fused ATPase/permease subunit
LWPSLRQLYAFKSPERRRHFYFVLSLMIVGAFAEIATIGAVLPFIALLADQSRWEYFPFIRDLFDALGADKPRERLIAASGMFVAIALLAGMIRLQLAWSSQSFVFKLGHELSVEIQKRILYQPYSFHISWNSSRLVAAMEKVQMLVFQVLLPLMQALTAIFISAFITAGLIVVDPFTALVSAASFAAIYFGISLTTMRRLASDSGVVAATFDERVKIIQESLGGIRDVIIDASQAIYLETFRRIDARLNKARMNTAFIAAAPRFVIEALGMILIAVIAILISDREGGLAGALPILGALALGAQRLLPLLQQIYNGWTIATGHGAVMTQVLDLLQLPMPDEHSPHLAAQPLTFEDRICIEDVSFSYRGTRAPALERIRLEIPRGSTVALIGTTGSGKTTLADLVMGLLEPTEGQITVDGVPIAGKTRQRWWQSIAHVPQAIFLADTSVARNIAAGAPSEPMDMALIEAAARTAQLHEFVESLPEGYETLVGERGVRLSGGQRQRLGLARAIYKRAPVLVLDEATSALDDITEAAVMHSLEELGEHGRTVIMIAHRLSTVARCDVVARLEKGRLAEVGSYAEVLGDTPHSRKL